MTNFYLGVAATVHDPAIAVLDENGNLLFAEALERPLQYKIAWDVTPTAMFDYLSKIILGFHAPTAQWSIALSWEFEFKESLPNVDPDCGADSLERFKQNGIPDASLNRWLLAMQSNYLIRLKETLPYIVESITGQAKVDLFCFDHHLTHAANACYFYDKTDPALCMIVDGDGEVGSLSCYAFENGRLNRLARSWGPGSLGMFYSSITNICGFNWKKGEEWKVMGLAAYGNYDEDVYRKISRLIHLENGKLLPIQPDVFRQVLGHYLPDIPSFKSDPLLAKDIAFTAQYLFEEVMTDLLNFYQKKHGHKQLILSGGCALNSKFNGEIIKRTAFDDVFVPPAPGDDGNAVGAAVLLSGRDKGMQSLMQEGWQTPYLGGRVESHSLNRVLQQIRGLDVKDLGNEIYTATAKKLAEGKLVAWVQGRSEYGPRALGNRSILADPRTPDIKVIINSKVKFREGYRPFAPSIIHEFGNDWFEQYQDSPYMSKTLVWRHDKRDKVPGVVHKDGTGRVQSVTQERNHDFYTLLDCFYRISDVPILLNTSLNVMGKPIVHSIEDIIGVFMTTGLDVLVIDSFMIEK